MMVSVGTKGRRRSTTGPLVALTVVLAGCASATLQREDPFTDPVAADHVRIYVENDNFMDARLWALGLSTRTSVGTVPGKKQTSFTIPWDRVEPMQIEIDLLAGRKYTTRTLDVSPGEVLTLRIKGDSPRLRQWE